MPNQLIVALAGLSKAMMGFLVEFLAPLYVVSVHVCVCEHAARLEWRQAEQEANRALRELVVAFAACKHVGRGWVVRENASPAPRIGLGLLCAPLCVAQCMDMAGSGLWSIYMASRDISKFIYGRS